MSGDTESKIIQKLDELEQKEGELPRFAQLYRQLLQLQNGARSRLTPPSPDRDEDTITERLTRGIPLLSFADLSLDWAQVQDLFQEMTRLVAMESPEVSEVAERMGSTLSDTALLKEAVKAWYKETSLTPIATRYDINDELLGYVVATVLKPFLAAHAGVLLPRVDHELWHRRYCPVCGARPDFAYLDKESGARWLLCSRCDAEWLFQRLECPHCGTQDQDALAYFTNDDGLYRLYVCERCKGYLKAIDLRQTDSEVLLPLERLLTLQFDMQAQEQGYSPRGEVDTDGNGEGQSG